MKHITLPLAILLCLSIGCTTQLYVMVKLKKPNTTLFIKSVALITPTNASTRNAATTLKSKVHLSKSFLLFSKRHNILLIECRNKNGDVWSEGFFLKPKNLRPKETWITNISCDFKGKAGNWLNVLHNPKEYKNKKNPGGMLSIDIKVTPDR